MRRDSERKDSKIQNQPRRRHILLLQRQMQKEIQTKQRQIHKIKLIFLTQTQTFGFKQLFNKPKQLITKQNSNNVGRPQYNGPITWNVMPKISLSGKNFHANQRKQPSNRQVNLLLKIRFNSVAFAVKHQKCPCT